MRSNGLVSMRQENLTLHVLESCSLHIKGRKWAGLSNAHSPGADLQHCPPRLQLEWTGWLPVQCLLCLLGTEANADRAQQQCWRAGHTVLAFPTGLSREVLMKCRWQTGQKMQRAVWISLELMYGCEIVHCSGEHCQAAMFTLWYFVSYTTTT